MFGQYIDIYDIAQAVNDNATVRIYYESRLAKVNLTEEGKQLIEEFDKETEAEELTDKQRAKIKWARLEAIVGNEDRIKNVAQDIVTHFEGRTIAADTKAMIVAMNREIAVKLYNAIVAIRPEWHNDDLHIGMIKTVMTASSDDGPEMKKHHTSKGERKTLAARMKDENDALKIVIVIDMWLTGFDAPVLKTLYVDKPMKGHSLMQAIARVNRIFKDVKGGLVVDYLGIGTDLKYALSFYADAGGKGKPTENVDKAIELMLEKFEVVEQMFNEESKTHDDILMEEPQAYYKNSFVFNYRRFFHVEAKEKLSIILQAEEHILGLQNGKERFIKEVSLLSQRLHYLFPMKQH